MRHDEQVEEEGQGLKPCGKEATGELMKEEES